MLNNIRVLPSLNAQENSALQLIGKLALGMVPEVATNSATITRDTLPPLYCQLYKNDADTALYFNINNSICYLGFNGTMGLNASSGDTIYYINGSWVCHPPSRIYDADQDTKVDTEESPDEDVIRMDCAGTEIVTANNDQFAVNTGIKLGLEGKLGDTYMKFNTPTSYLEMWVDGIKRVEM
jgi:hypothetical protein